MTIIWCIISFIIGGTFGVFLTALAVASRRGDDLASRIHCGSCTYFNPETDYCRNLDTCVSHCGYCYLARPKDGDPDADR